MAYRSSAVAKSDSGGDLTATPAGSVANDYLSGFFSKDSTGQTIGAPSGWTIQYTGNPTSPDSQSFRYADKVAAGSDSFTFTSNAANQSILICAAHSGRDTSATPTSFRTGTENTSTNASAITAGANGGTAASGDDLLAYFGTDGTSPGGVWSFNAASGPGAFTQRQNDSTPIWSSSSLSTLDNYGGGATGTVTETITLASGSAGWTAVIIAVKAAAGGAAMAQIPRTRPFPYKPGSPQGLR